MPELTFRPQMTVVDPDTKIGTVKHVHNYIRLSQGREAIYVQDGFIYHGGGDPVEQSALPSWFWDSYRACTPAARRAVGLELPGDSKVVGDPASASIASITQFSDLPDFMQKQLLEEAAMLVQAPRMPQDETSPLSEGVDTGDDSDPLPDDPEALRPSFWSCGECKQLVEMRLKGIHIAHHRRAAKVRS